VLTDPDLVFIGSGTFVKETYETAFKKIIN